VTTYLTYLTSLLIHPAVLSGPLQPAAVLIQAGRLPEAHRLLLKLSRRLVRNPHLWLMLAWTAPTSTAAYQYFLTCSRLDPSNELAAAGLAHLRAFAPGNPPAGAVDAPPFGGAIITPASPPAGAIIAPGSPLGGAVYAPPISGPHSGPLSERTAPSAPPFGPNAPPLRRRRLDQTQRAKGPTVWSAPPPAGAVAAPPSAQSLPNRLLHLSGPRFRWLVLLYLLLLAAAELLTTFARPQLGLAFHGFLLVLLFLHASLLRVKAQQRLLYTLALAPLIRLLSLSMPLTPYQFSYWYAIIGLPLLLAAFLVLRLTAYRPVDVGLTIRKLPLNLIIGLIGLPLGWLEYQILKPPPLLPTAGLPQLLLAALILLVFTGFLEEFIFRGLMQRASYNIMGIYGLYWVSLLFAVLHIGYRSLPDFCFVLLVGLTFAHIVKRTGSIWGVTLAHGLTNITLYLLIPLLIR
jgi:membrane protease YdiL (CAAX protease family)